MAPATSTNQLNNIKTTICKIVRNESETSNNIIHLLVEKWRVKDGKAEEKKIEKKPFTHFLFRKLCNSHHSIVHRWCTVNNGVSASFFFFGWGRIKCIERVYCAHKIIEKCAHMIFWTKSIFIKWSTAWIGIQSSYKQPKSTIATATKCANVPCVTR